MAEAPDHFVILIGVNAYKERPLRGCVNDVRNIERDLEKNHYSGSIKTFTATASPDPASDWPFVEEEDALPTHQNIMGAIRHIRETAKEGDRVYIHYSGHGTQMPPDDDPDNDHTNRLTGDLALCLLEEYWPGETEPGEVDPLEGRRFAGMMNGLVAKGIVLTVVLDCCYSASVYRGDNDETEDLEDKAVQEEDDSAGRYLPWALVPKKRKTHRDESPEPEATISRTRDVSMRSNWLIDPRDYSLLVACGPHEVASEISAGGKSYGKLSYFLHNIFYYHGLNRKQKGVYNHLQIKFREGAGRLKQMPVLYGNKDQTFFGQAIAGRDGSSASLITRIPMTVKTDGTIELLAGEAHGLMAGDTVFLYTSSLTGRAPGSDVGIIEGKIDTVNAVTSVLAVVDPSSQKTQQLIQFRWEAEPRARQRFDRFPIHLDSSLSSLDTWRACLNKNFLIECNAEDQPGYRVRLAEIEEKKKKYIGYQILDLTGKVLPNIPPMPKDEVEVEDVTAVLAHVINYKIVQSITSPSLPTEADDFCSTFDVFAQSRDGRRFNPGEAIEVRESADRRWNIEIFIKNNGTNALYVYPYSLGSRWQVEHVSFSSTDVHPSHRQLGEGFPGRSDSLNKKLKTTVPEAMRAVGYCEDVLKIFVTSHPTTFDLLELPVIGLLQKKEEPTRDPIDLVNVPERWAVFDFVIKTVCAPGSTGP